MPRDIDSKKTRRALRKLRKARDRMETNDHDRLTDWEQEFVEGVEERLETYGSAFNDPEKGSLDEALSARQMEIVRQIDKKARGKGLKRSGFKSKSPSKSKNYRDINSDAPPDLTCINNSQPQMLCPPPNQGIQSGHRPSVLCYE